MKNFGFRIKESFRKFLVSVKRNPQMIPMLVLVAAFLVYSLNLTDVSDSTAKIQGVGMGLCQFAMMLLTLLSMVCMLNAFPKRKKANVPMIVLMYVMFAAILYCDIHYYNAIVLALTRAENPIVVTAEIWYIYDAAAMLINFGVMIVVTAVLVALLPLYSRLLKKINTNIDVEDNGEMAEIEISD